MSNFARAQLSGFNHFPVETCLVARPEQVTQLRQLVGSAERDFIPRGAGRGLGDNALNRDGGVILLERLDRLLDFDAQGGVVHCEGGCTLARIVDTFLPRGWFPAVTPGTKYITIGGAIAADVHGKNHHRDGSFASCLIDFELLLPSGEVLLCSRASNPEVFWATVGGMGLTGVILGARFQLRRVESAFCTVEYEQAPNLDEVLRRFAETDHLHRYSVAWIDCLASGPSLGRSVLMQGDHTPADQVPEAFRARPLEVARRRPRSIPVFLPKWVLNHWAVKAFNWSFYRRHKKATRVVDYDTFFYPLDRISNYYRMYGRRGFIQYQAVFPRETSRTALAQMLQKLAETRSASFLAVLKSMGPADDGLLSFPMPGHTLALDMPNTGQRLLELVRELDRIVLEHQGRVYLAKDMFLTRDKLERMYPSLPEFMRIKGKLDPQNRIASSLARRLELVGAA